MPVYNVVKQLALQGGLDLDTGGMDVRCALLMTNTTGDTDIDEDVVGNIGTLDEFDGANYARKTLTGEAVVRDDADDVSYADANDPVWTALGNGTRAAQGVLFFAFDTDDTASIPLTFNAFSVGQNPGGSEFTALINAEGYLKLT